MAATFQTLGLGGLTFDEKLAVVGQLWDDLFAAGPATTTLTDAQSEELCRRQEYARANPDDWVSWEEARAATLKRLAR